MTTVNHRQPSMTTETTEHHTTGSVLGALESWRRQVVQSPDGTLYTDCPICGGLGVVDSGGVTPWGSSIEVRCGCCQPHPDESQTVVQQRHEESVRHPDSPATPTRNSVKISKIDKFLKPTKDDTDRVSRSEEILPGEEV